MKAFADLDLAAALQFNPLVFAATLFILSWIVVMTADRIAQRPVLHGLRSRLRAFSPALIAAVLVVANWIYLIVFLP